MNVKKQLIDLIKFEQLNGSFGCIWPFTLNMDRNLLLLYSQFTKTHVIPQTANGIALAAVSGLSNITPT